MSALFHTLHGQKNLDWRKMLGYNSRSYVNFILILDKALSSLTEDKFLQKRLTTQMGGLPIKEENAFWWNLDR